MTAHDEKYCPFCKETIKTDAIICRFCQFDTTAQYEPCQRCGELIKCIALICKHCSNRKPPHQDPGLGITVPFTPKQPKDGGLHGLVAKVFKSEPGSYGSGVRAQVFEVIVRQGMNGAPWREICAGPMRVNNISEEEVEAEIRRRRGH